ncbi:hypothetical protein SAMN05421810_109241 [Amycolatopsis arida]|uniref:Uncharacterized protein n=1 Tax=Amycolatopsis arida TaxID=587909 RepID=A0A1I5ZJ07_9PSEU|nr:hypothetical protein [Amycolatopsis arida]TDX89720.1 hypothetical protein CLV69_109241 [Amycolatopsis arida]SFQ56469.1 hypothetical protein SAMN05421810_109241 [Amycolatopsis arida]
MPTSRSPGAPVPAAVAAVGLVVVVVGTFLPWLRSGSVRRSSYETASLVDHFSLLDHALLGAVLRSWVAVPLVAASCVALLAVRLSRTAAIGTIVLAIVVGTVAVGVLVQGGDASGPVGLVPAGPLACLAGSTIALIGALGVLATSRRIRAHGRAGIAQ